MDNYFIKEGYKVNPQNITLDHVSGKSFWDKEYIRLSHAAQYYVYKTAYEFARENQIDTILDIGCGVGTLLNHFFGEHFKVFGIDQPSAVEYCRLKYKNGTFMSDDFENPTYKLKETMAKFPLVICADVIEHLSNPVRLLEYIKKFSDRDTFIIISTPERDYLHGKSNNSPTNPHHVREWNFSELNKFIPNSGFTILEHAIIYSNRIQLDRDTIRWFVGKTSAGLPIKHTQMIICKPNS